MSLVDLATGVVRAREVSARKERYASDPVLWAKDYLGISVWRAQREILESIRDNRNTAVAAGHGVGKTYIAAVAVAWWVDTHPPEKTFIASTAPSADQVFLLWDNLRRIHGLARQRYNTGLVDHPLPGEILGDNKWKLPDGSLLGQGRKPPDKDSDVAFQGRHADFLFAIGDEAVGLNSGFLEALGNIATSAGNRQLLLANPTDPGSAMAKLWDPKITHWNRLHISVLDSPAIVPDPDFDLASAPAISGWDYVEEKRAEWGEDDPRYIARVLGQWAFDAGNTVYTAEEIARAKNTTVVPYDDATPEHGWDIARKGADSTTGYELVRGRVWETDSETGKPVRETSREGLHVRRVGEWSKAPLTGNDPENPSSSWRIHDLAIDRGAGVVKVDASGLGAGIVDGLASYNPYNSYYLVFEVFGGAAPSDKRAYKNLRAEQFFWIKKLMSDGLLDLDPVDEKLFDDLSGIQYENVAGGIIKIEAKEDIRKRGRKSPDSADALWYAVLDVSALLDPINQLTPGSVVVKDPGEVVYDRHWDAIEF